MPSDFISLLSADLDLESPKSLYSKGESATEAAPGLLGQRASQAAAASAARAGLRAARAVGASRQASASEPRGSAWGLEALPESGGRGGPGGGESVAREAKGGSGCPELG